MLSDNSMTFNKSNLDHYFYELARNYFDEQTKDSTTFRRRTTRFEQCFERLPDEFTTEQFTKAFGYANNRSASKYGL